MSELEYIYKNILNYFKSVFDFSLLSGDGDTFIGLTYIKRVPGLTPEISSVYFYPQSPNKPDKSINELIQLIFNLTTNYLKNVKEKVSVYIDNTGYASSFVFGQRDILIVLIISDPDNYNFLFKTIENQLNVLSTNKT
ncbi:hypothetical protein A2572_02385 [Candidatus Collierbacteria bacterium RIFOXYD1_FULL_40_9]|uniref:Uncharacterized protein n=1 Tax=Candidatus Collierbacteria bacterium RIFOXYD1_FULL_40_9 TaxID=1817731 RepID=A0A1F5FP61_9BACT|nr:MAG: hypothetical protein A2572_02385 [Candidatus Collierbacteria bacterium RIFOXYD1_FULL_40_9]